MAAGDEAAAAGMDTVPGSTPANTIDTELNKSRDYIAQFFDAVKTWATGLFLPKTDVVVSDGGTPIANKVPRYTSANRMIVGYPLGDNDVANKAYVTDAVNGVNLSSRVAKSGDTMTGDLTISGSGNHLFVPDATPATSGYTNAYINGDGRLSKGASAERFKKYISEIDPSSLGDAFPGLWRFQMRQGDGSWRYGWIADRLAEDPATQPFVVYDADGQVESIDFIALLIVENAQLNARVKALEARDE